MNRPEDGRPYHPSEGDQGFCPECIEQGELEQYSPDALQWANLMRKKHAQLDEHLRGVSFEGPRGLSTAAAIRIHICAVRTASVCEEITFRG